MSVSLSRPAAGERLLALDWLRGLVMAVMAVDHVDAVVNTSHAANDGLMVGGAFVTLSAGSFLTRWCTHLCAPTFVFLAGTSMALSVARAQARGVRERAIDGHWLLRGALLVLLEATLVSFYWRLETPQLGTTFQVLYALGVGLVAMVLLRRLPDRALLALAILLPVACEALHATIGVVSGSLPAMLLVTGGPWPSWMGLRLLVMYPALPWLAPMVLGYWFGRQLGTGTGPDRAARPLLAIGVGGVVLFFAVRGINASFGNMGLTHGAGVLQWLHTSKYPPSIAFLALELGIMALLLAALLVVQRLPRLPGWRVQPLLVLGQVPLFYYLLHLPLIHVLGELGVLPGRGTWSTSWLGAGVVVLLLWPLCGLYRHYKQVRGAAWTRYL